MPSCEDWGEDLDACMEGYEDCMAEQDCDDDWRDAYEECAEECTGPIGPFASPWDCAECTYELAVKGEECIALEQTCEEQMEDCEDEFMDYWDCIENHPYASAYN